MNSYLFNFGSVYFIIEARTVWTAARKAKEKHGQKCRLVDMAYPALTLVPKETSHGPDCEECRIFLSKCYCDARGS